MKRNILTIIFIVAIVALISGALFTVRTSDLLARIPLIGSIYSTSISISSPRGVANVNINGQDYGQTPVELTDLPSGDYLIQLERVTPDGEFFYKPLIIDFKLEKDTEAIIDMEIGPNNFNHGYILYYTNSPRTSSNQGLLTINSNAPNPSLKINSNTQSGDLSLISLDEGQYELEVSAEGYESIILPVIIRNQYNLILKVSQMPIPVIFEEANAQ